MKALVLLPLIGFLILSPSATAEKVEDLRLAYEAGLAQKAEEDLAAKEAKRAEQIAIYKQAREESKIRLTVDSIIPSEVLAATVSSVAFVVALYFPVAYLRREKKEDTWSQAQPGANAFLKTSSSLIVSCIGLLMGGQNFWNDVKINIEYPNAKPVDLHQ